MKTTNQFLKKYYKDIKHTFPVYGKNERNYLEHFQDCIQSYYEDHPDITPEKIIKEFGTPSEIISEYLANINNEYLITTIRKSSFIKKGICAIVLILLLLSICRSTISYLAYKDAQEHNIAYEETIIIEE